MLHNIDLVDFAVDKEVGIKLLFSNGRGQIANPQFAHPYVASWLALNHHGDTWVILFFLAVIFPIGVNMFVLFLLRNALRMASFPACFLFVVSRRRSSSFVSSLWGRGFSVAFIRLTSGLPPSCFVFRSWSTFAFVVYLLDLNSPVVFICE